MHRVRPYLTFSRIWLRAGWTVAVGLIGIAVTVVGAVAGVEPLTGVGAALLLIGAVAAGVDIAKVRRELGDLYPNPALARAEALDRDPEYSEAELLTLHHGTALIDDEVNARLAETSRLQVSILEDDYRLPRVAASASAGAIVEAWKTGRRDFDAPKVRLCSDFGSQAEFEPVVVQRTRFVHALVTNDLAEREYWSRSRRVKLLGPEHVPYPPAGRKNSDGTPVLRLPSLRDSACSNHVGVDIVAFLRTGELVVGKQSAANAQSPGLYASSGSGSADWSDLVETEDFLAFLRHAMARELREECGLSERQIDEAGIQVLGFSRFLHRGGKPQFFGWAPWNIDEADLRRSGAERRFVDDQIPIPVDWDSIEGWTTSLRDFLTEQRVRVSVPLHVNIELLLRWVHRRPDRFETLRDRIRPGLLA